MTQQRHTLRAYIDILGELVKTHTLNEKQLQTEIDCLSYDTRRLHGRSLFICKGAHFREEYLAQAIASGAVAYLAEQMHPQDAPCIIVSDLRAALLRTAGLYYNGITQRVVSIGITGTKGKSTTAYYMRSILNHWLHGLGKPDCAILSSIDTYDGVISEESHITTPEVLELYQHFQNAFDSGISHLVMEVSSQALKYGRVTGMCFDVGCFTNIGEDHISPIEHPDFDDYFRAKQKLFSLCRTGCINTDAAHAEEVLRAAEGQCDLITFGSHESDTVYCSSVEKRADGIYFTVRSPRYNGTFSITMPGLFNVSNALAAMAMSMALGIPEESVRDGLRVARAAGRMQVYESRDHRVTVVVDYAHNRMSFDALYRSTKVEYPGRKIITIFGCPGYKALLRRRDLGELSGQNSDYVYLTEEDSGEEPFADIAADIAQYVACPHTIDEDRAACIRSAIMEQEGERVILLTGKGEETRMKRGTEYVDFPSDVELTLRYLAEYDEGQVR